MKKAMSVLVTLILLGATVYVLLPNRERPEEPSPGVHSFQIYGIDAFSGWEEQYPEEYGGMAYEEDGLHVYLVHGSSDSLQKQVVKAGAKVSFVTYPYSELMRTYAQACLNQSEWSLRSVGFDVTLNQVNLTLAQKDAEREAMIRKKLESDAIFFFYSDVEITF